MSIATQQIVSTEKQLSERLLLIIGQLASIDRISKQLGIPPCPGSQRRIALREVSQIPIGSFPVTGGHLSPQHVRNFGISQVAHVVPKISNDGLCLPRQFGEFSWPVILIVKCLPGSV